MSKPLCEYCEKEAKYIWWTKDATYKVRHEVRRPVLYPLCEEHGSNMFPRIVVKIETK